MGFKNKGLAAVDALPTTTQAVRTLPAAMQRELAAICRYIGRDDKLSATTTQIARFEEIRPQIEFDAAGTDWATLRARMNAIGGSITRTHPEDGPVQFVLASRWSYGLLSHCDTLQEAIEEVESDEVEFAQQLDYSRKLAIWKDGVAARKARKAAREAAKAVAA